MKLNKKGFVSSAVLYSLLLLFLALILGLLALLSNRKQILDKLKGDIKSEINQTKNYKKYENGTAIYYNPVTGKICGNYTEENSKTGVTEGCLKWYIFNDDKNKATVNMILDHNTTALTAWASLEDYIEADGTEEEYSENGNNKGPLTITKKLNEDTENWKNKARLISADEIAKITGAKDKLDWTSDKIYATTPVKGTSISYFYLDGLYGTNTTWHTQIANLQGASKYAWLYDNTKECTSYGCNVEDLSTAGYWTSTPVVGIYNYAWNIQRFGTLFSHDVSSDTGRGVRPVITVSKKDIYTQYKEEILKGTDPVYSDNLIPVTIADNGTVTKADTSTEWYKYENQKWANAVILNDESKTFNNGEIIPESDIESYFVWIPKYKYKLFDLGNYTTYEGTSQPEKSNAKTIDIVFGTTNTIDSNEGECTTPGVSGETGNCEVGKYMTHPAFLAFNTNGLWVGKFETTGSIEKLTVKPGIKSISEQTVKSMFDASYDYKRTNDSHMMKNTEWGAVAYLSHSKYGINKEININNNSDLLTGYSAVEDKDQSKYPGTYGTDSSVTLAYNTKTGYLASTTGNVTGIYDMSGGSYEYVSSYVDGQLGSSGFSSDPITTYGDRYFDNYISTSTFETYNNRILGDATGEMGPFYYYMDGDKNGRNHNGWYSDASYFVQSDQPWFFRGGVFNGGLLSSQFYFYMQNGMPKGAIGFRLVLTK